MRYSCAAYARGDELPERDAQVGDEFGKPVERTAEGFHARVVQHECDHLIGVLYPMRIRDLRNFGFTAELFPDEEIADE